MLGKRIKKAIIGTPSYLYSSFKKLVKSTTLFSKFSVSGDILQYRQGYVSWGTIEYTYTRPGIIKTYIENATNGLPSLKLYSEDLFKGRAKLVNFGATAIVLETLQVGENVYTYFINTPSLDGVMGADVFEASVEGQIKQVESIEARLKHDEFYDFLSEVEEYQQQYGLLEPEDIKNRFFSYRWKAFKSVCVAQFSNVAIALVFLVANILGVSMLFSIALTIMAAIYMVVRSLYLSTELDEGARNVTVGLAGDPETLLRTLESCLRLKRRSFFLSSETKKELKNDEKFLRKLRQLCAIQKAISEHDRKLRENVDNFANENISLEAFSKAKYAEFKYKGLDRYEGVLDELYRRADLGVNAVVDGMVKKYTTSELIKKEFKVLFRSILSKALFLGIGNILALSIIAAVFPVGVYSALYLVLLMVPVQSFMIDPMSKFVENAICRRLYIWLIRYESLAPIIRFCVSEKTLHEYDIMGKNDQQANYLEFARAADSAEFLDQYIGRDEVLLGTRFAYERVIETPSPPGTPDSGIGI